MPKSKLLVILGPTSSGKSELAVELAKRFDGEVISADSRQVYQGLNIGTGKITLSEMKGVPHYGLDVVEPDAYFSVANFKKLADATIRDIANRGKLPIFAGGTGLYIQAVVDNVLPPEVPPNEALRRELKDKTRDELLKKLQKLDSKRAAKIDTENPRRLIRAIEIATALGNVPKIDIAFPTDYTNSPYDVLQIGLTLPGDVLKEHIRARVRARLKNGWVEEVKKLLAAGVSREHLYEFGLGYRIIADTLASTLDVAATNIHSNILKNVRMSALLEPEIQEALLEKIATAEWRYAKRQLRWFKRDKRIVWFSPKETVQIETRVKKFLT